MERLAPFELLRPRTLAQAIDALAAAPGARAIAGGTDLVPNLRRGLGVTARVVDLAGVAGLDALDVRGAGARIGAGVTIARLAADRRVQSALPAVAQAAASVAAPALREAATVGGNLCADTRCAWYNQSAWWRASNGYCLKYGGERCHVAPTGDRCHAAYAGDLAPALIACGARAEIAGPAGTREIAIEDLWRDDGRAHLALAPAEILVAIQLPAQPRGAASGYRKARMRASIDFPLAGVAARLVLGDGRVATLDVALTGTNSRPFRLDGTDAMRGRPVDDALLDDLARAVRRQVSPMRTTLAQPHWRREVAATEARRLLCALAELAS